MVNHTTDATKSQILTLKSIGVASSAVARIVGVNHGTVNRIYRCFLKPHTSYPHTTCTGRPHKMTAADDQFAVLALAQLRAGNATQLQREYFPNLHPDTECRHL
jgi:hypothetical protein